MLQCPGFIGKAVILCAGQIAIREVASADFERRFSFGQSASPASARLNPHMKMCRRA
jgi:hypothetical protein